MAYQLTPAAERAMIAAARWIRGGDGGVLPVGPVEMILGLLHESECRAARLLREADVDEAAVRRQWPDLTSLDEDAAAAFSTRGLGAAVESGLRAACERLDESLRSFQFATEHVLLGLTLADDDVGAWLRRQGVDAEAVERDHARLYGGERTPIALDDLTPIPLAEIVDASSGTTSVDRPSVADGNGEDRQRTGLLRLLDAAANRAGEALRVVEDHARFVLDDAAIVAECKAMRHELTAAAASLPLDERLAARDTAGDVGTSISTAAETTRRDPADVAAANVRRLQESLRSLEEYAKLFDPAAAARYEALRYRSYTLHKSLFANASNKPSLSQARLYVLVDGRGDADEFVKLIGSLVASGVDVIQLRDKRLDDRALLARARLVRELTRGTPVRFIMNDRADLAVLADADGVHVGQEELTVADARRIVGPQRLIGVSTHSLEQARQAVSDGADYLGIGPVFPGETKSFEAYPGLDLVRAVAAESLPAAFAIGGITPANVDDVLRAGLRRIAVSGAVVNAADPGAVVRELLAKLDRA